MLSGSGLFIVYSICFFGADAYQFLCVFVNDLGISVIFECVSRSMKQRQVYANVALSFRVFGPESVPTVVFARGFNPFFDLRPLESHIFVGFF